MKKNFLTSLQVILFLFIIEVNAQSIWFINPTNGQTITGTGAGSSQNTVPLNLSFNKTNSNDPNLIGTYVKLFPAPYGTQESPIDQWWYLPSGTYTWRLELWETYVGLGSHKVAEQTITFYVKYAVTVSNNFGGGTIKIDGITKSSGSSTIKTTGENLLVGAIDQTYNNQYYLWNQNGTNNSIWRRRPMGGSFSNLPGGTPRNFNYSIASNDNGAEIQAAMRARFNITRNDQSLEFGSQFNSANTQIIEGNPLQAPSPQTIGSNTYYFVDWSDGVTSNPRTITTGTTPLTARYKALHKSSDANAFSNSSQRKLVKTKDNWMHQVYESMGYVWIEHSTNNGSTWFLGNNGKPIGNGVGKCPSIDWHYNTADPSNPNYNAVIVVYQKPYSTTYRIDYAIFKYTSGSYVLQSQSSYGSLYTEPAGGGQYSTTNANPTIAWGRTYNFALTFERKSTVGSMQPGIYWIYGYIYESGIEPVSPYPTPPVKISGTTSSSMNASISLNKSIADDSRFDVVYQTAATAPSNITNVGLYVYHNGSSWYTDQEYTSMLSNGTGYLNTKPSMVQMSDNNIRVCWIRNMYGSTSQPHLVNVTYWNSASPSVFNYSGNGVNSVSLNIRDGYSNTYYAYAQYTNNTTWQNFARNGSSTITLNTTGRHIQLSNGSSSSNMYASAYYPVSLPYYFQTTGSLGGLLKSSDEENTYGRGIILATDKLGFSYSIKSLAVDKAPVKFVEIPENKNQGIPGDTTVQREKMQHLTLDSLNTMLVSEPFTIKEGTLISFSEAGGFMIGEQTDNAAIQQAEKNYRIGCKIELIEDATNKTIGEVKVIQFTLGDGQVENLRASNLKINSKEEKVVRLKFSFTTNIEDAKGMFVNEFNTVNENILSKIAAEELSLDKEGLITTYAMEQNYPNPFNPSTTIKYQIPEAGFVTLKIYDVLGKEIKTLINGNKNIGRYEIKFDASDLASGMYIYQLKVNNPGGGTGFVASKKMLLVK